jgi:ATP-dependent Clp protease adaptor protein ClpS
MFHTLKYPMANTQSTPDFKQQEETEVLDSSGFVLIVWNDDINTFEWVIKTLIEVCGHEKEQAEQCAMLIHTKGKYGVKNGDYDELRAMCDIIVDRGIGATVEEVVS